MAVTGPVDPHDLKRFLDAQAFVYDRALAELKRGRKESHWMWFVFPQVAGLGLSERSVRYAIRSLDEAAAYAAHPVLGSRLRDCTGAVLAVEGRSAHDIFGAPDDRKFQSSMALFEKAAPDEPLFPAALERYFAGGRDHRTLELLGRMP